MQVVTKCFSTLKLKSKTSWNAKLNNCFNELSWLQTTFKKLLFLKNTFWASWKCHQFVRLPFIQWAINSFCRTWKEISYDYYYICLFQCYYRNWNRTYDNEIFCDISHLGESKWNKVSVENCILENMLLDLCTSLNSDLRAFLWFIFHA